MSNYPLGANEDINAPWHDNKEGVVDCSNCNGEGLDEFGICIDCKGTGLVLMTDEMLEDQRINGELDNYELMHDET